MGAWGYGYDDNDNYYNMAEDFTQPLIESLNAEMNPRGNSQDLRARLMWTVKVLMNTDEEVQLSASSLRTLYEAVNIIREEADANAEDWRDPEEFREVISAELRLVEEWLDSFEDIGFLGDRLGPLLEAIRESEKE